MKILIDESLPHYLLSVLGGYDAYTVQYMGWSGIKIKNGALRTLAEEQSDVFLTADKNLRYQQNLTRRTISLVVFPSNRLSVVKQVEFQLQAILETITPGTIIEL
jgi:hypothetical protein